jgi:glycosyltransferase involved in cell wall biosynthesis
MRVLIVTAQPPLPFGHAAARWFYVLLRELTRRGHRVTMFSACATEREKAEAQALFPRPEYDLRCHRYPERGGWASKLQTLRRPYGYMFSPELERDVRAEAERGFDVLHLEEVWCGWVGRPWRERAFINFHNLYDVDLQFSPPRGLADRARRALLFRAEHRLAREYGTLVGLSEPIAAFLRQLNPRARTFTVPLGLDVSRYAFTAEERAPHPPTVGLIGSFSWVPTYTAGLALLHRLWPRIQREVPEARLLLVGRDARTALKDYVGLPSVEIHENVPDTAPYFEATDVMLYAPQVGSGMKVKVLEALAQGTPVVTTRDGVEGLPAVDGVHAGICDDDAGLVERTVALLKDAALRRARRLAGRELIERTCGPGPTVDALERVYEAVRGGNAVGPGLRRDA